MTLETRIADLATAVANHIRDNINPRLAPEWVEQAGASHTLSNADLGKGISMTAAGENVVIVPNDDEAAIPVNTRIEVEMAGVGQTRINPDTGVQIFCDPRVAKRLAARYCTAILTKRGANIWRLVGSLTPTIDIDPPVIDSFTLSDASIENGGSATLSWASTNGLTASISPGVGTVPVDGNTIVSPAETTVYTLTVTNEAGPVTQSVTLTVEPLPPQQEVNATWGGTDDANTFVDDNGRTWTGQGQAVLTNTSPLIAPTSGNIPNTDSYWSTTEQLSELDFGTGDFYIEYFLRATSNQATGPDTNSGAPGGWVIAHNTPGAMFWYNQAGVYLEGDGVTYGITNQAAGGCYVCVEREAGVVRGYMRDKKLFEGADTTDYNTVPTLLTFGRRQESPTNRPMTGDVGWLRIKKGECRWPGGPSDITPEINPAPQPANLPGDIVNAQGVVVQAAYEDMALNYSLPAKGLAYRFGAPASATGVGTLTQRADLGSILYPSSARIYYQFGAEDNNLLNDFVSSHGAVIFRPTVGTAVDEAVGRFSTYGIDRRTISQRPQLIWSSPVLTPPQVDDYITGNATYGSQLSATDPADIPVCQYRWVGPADGGADKMSLIGTQGSATRGARIFAVGTETGQQRGICELAPGKVPTAIAITNGGEFAFVTVWDYVNHKGQVVVISLGSVPMNCTWQNVDNWYDWWHEFTDHCHPGLKNKGGWAFMKVLGYVDLPANMKAPTAAHAYTGVHPYETVYHDDGLGQPGSITISGVGKEASPLEANRARLLDFNDFGKYITKGGLLTVSSKSEKTVCFLDLEPLFTYTNGMYLDSAASNIETQYYQLNGAGAPAGGLGTDGKRYLNTTNGDVYLKTAGAWAVTHNIGTKRGLGMSANHWPYLLADVPQAMPEIIKTVTLADRPIGICSPVSYNYWSKDWQRREPGTPYWMASPRYPRVWVATENGKIHIYSAGRWVPGSKPPDQAPVAAEIAEIGVITGLGEQITHITGVKDYDVDDQDVVYDDPGEIPGSLDEMCMLVDRKNRAIKFVQFTVTSGDGGSIVGTLADSRMDPVTAEQVDAYYKSNKVVVVADYTGQCVRTYRARTPVPLTYDSTGTGAVAYPTLDVGGEYGGKLDVPGLPFSAVTSNAP